MEPNFKFETDKEIISGNIEAKKEAKNEIKRTIKAY